MTKVFLVDDEIVIREGIRNSFPWDETEYQLVGEAPDGEIALPMIRDTRPDILITDIRMPFMDGLALCRAVRRLMPWIGIVILSGYDEFEYARQAIQLGVKEYLLKPITARELRRVLDKVNADLQTERLDRERSESLRIRMESGNLFVKQKLLSTLYSEDAAESDAVDVITQLRGMDLLPAADRYAVIDASFEPAAAGLEALMELAESSGGIAHVTGSRAGGRVLVLGESDSEAEERAYAFAASAVTELERNGCVKIRAGIGETVDSPARILQSMKSARHIRHVLGDQESETPLVVGVRDFSEAGDGGSAHAVVARAKLYMSQHYTDSNLMLQDVAHAVGMSESRFSTVFSQESGKTFTEYLTGLRLNRARELLVETDRRSSQIALDAGYNDAHYFSYLFKKNIGMTPGEYRAQNQNKPK
ncbi:MAG: response regulator [Clostridia bacterium]|nr:response regulator [Clostridia bacterium]